MKDLTLSSQRVLIAGLNVTVQQRNGKWYGPTPHWRILELFHNNIRGCCFGAIQMQEGAGRSICDYALDQSLEILPLNEGPYSELGRFKEEPRLYTRLLRAIAQSDYVHIRLPSWAGLAAWRCTEWLGKPYWLSIHGDWEQILSTYVQNTRATLPQIYYRFNRHLVKRSLTRAIANARCTFVIGKVLENRLIPPSVSSVVFHDSTHLASEVWSPRRVCTTNTTQLLFVGEITKAKGVHILLQAAKLLSQQGHHLCLTFVGIGPEISVLQEQKIPRIEINIKGWVQQGAEFDTLFRNADALVLPSVTEGVPRVIIEAMVRATPIIATKVGEIPEILGNGRRGWLANVNDTESLAFSIKEFLTDENSRMAKVTEASLYVKTYDKSYWSEVIRSNIEKINPKLVHAN